MNFNRSIWFNQQREYVEVIDQRKLPFQEISLPLIDLKDFAFAISDMVVRGAPLIGVTAAYGIHAALKEGLAIQTAYDTLLKTRPTAINLKWALDRQIKLLSQTDKENHIAASLAEAHKIAHEDIQMCSDIGDHGLSIIQSIYSKKKAVVNILTHCNAGWLATVKWGTATAPMYKAQAAGIPIHIYVDETRPRNQGARLTAWELHHAGIHHEVIADNTGGHLMQHNMVDLVLVGSDRTTANGDVCNKIGTYLKALAAHDNNVPFYAALPSSTIDWTIKDGVNEIPIEKRSSDEITHMNTFIDNTVKPVRIMANETKVVNYAFDVTPAKYVTGIITEEGICKANSTELHQLFNRDK